MTCASFWILGSAMPSPFHRMSQRWIFCRYLIIILTLFSIHPFDSVLDFRIAMCLTRHQWASCSFDFLPTCTHHLGAYVIAIGIMDYIQLIKFSANDAAMHFTFCVWLRHILPPTTIYKVFLFTDNLDQYTFPSATIELPVEDLLPCSEIEFPIRHGNDHLAAHDLAFHMCIGVIFARIVMTILSDWFVRCQFLQPFLVIIVQSAFVIVDKYGCRNVHCIYQNQTLFDPAFAQRLFHLPGDVHKSTPGWNVKLQLLAKRMHGYLKNEPTPT